MFFSRMRVAEGGGSSPGLRFLEAGLRIPVTRVPPWRLGWARGSARCGRALKSRAGPTQCEMWGFRLKVRWLG
jgi:hypothetical protein